MRYAAVYKPDSEALEQFIRRKGGINACAARFSRCRGRGAALDCEAQANPRVRRSTQDPRLGKLRTLARPRDKVQALRRGDQGWSVPTTSAAPQRAASGLAPLAPSAPDQQSACNGDRLRSLPPVGRHLETFPHVHGEI
jgi:hypothetical protein